MTLYDLTQAWTDFAAAVEAGEIPEEAIKDTLEAIEGELDGKAESIACLIKNLSAEEKAIAAEIKRLQERKSVKTNTQVRLKDYLYQQMSAVSKRKIETPRVVISIAKNPSSVKIEDEAKFKIWALNNDMNHLLTIKEPDISKTAIKQALEAGEQIDGAEIVQTESVRIK